MLGELTWVDDRRHASCARLRRLGRNVLSETFLLSFKYPGDDFGVAAVLSTWRWWIGGRSTPDCDNALYTYMPCGTYLVTVQNWISLSVPFVSWIHHRTLLDGALQAVLTERAPRTADAQRATETHIGGVT